MYALGQAAAALGVERRTLGKWLRLSNITPASDPADRRRLLLTVEQLSTLRAYRDREPASAPVAVPVAGVGLEQLVRQVAELTRRVERLERGADHRPSPASGRPRLPAVTATDGDSPPPADSAVRFGSQRATAPYAPLEQSDWQAMPAGWVAVSTWCEHHGVQRRSVERAVARGRMPQPQHAPAGVRWGPRGATIVYTPEQHAAAATMAGALWPDAFRPCPDCPHD